VRGRFAPVRGRGEPTRLDAVAAGAGAALAFAWLVTGAADGGEALRLALALGVLAVGALLLARSSGRRRDSRMFAGATFAFCGVVGVAEQLGSRPAGAALIAAALAGIVTVGLRSLRHS